MREAPTCRGRHHAVLYLSAETGEGLLLSFPLNIVHIFQVFCPIHGLKASGEGEERTANTRKASSLGITNDGYRGNFRNGLI